MKKLAVIASSICLLLLALFITTCTKEYSYEGGPQAGYILVGSPAECTEFKLNGNYYTGTATDAGNSVEVNVDVITTGNYSIITNAADGLSFAASGTFTDTGYHTITLQCTGTPTASGNFTFAITGSNGCTFSVEIADQPPASYDLSGAPDDCENPVFAGKYAVFNTLTIANTLTVNVMVASTGDYHISTDTVDGVNFSASGKFTTTGLQQIMLTGNGTPEASGIFYMNLKADSSNCRFALKIGSAEPLATYVLQSSNNGIIDLCTPQLIQGNYVANQQLDAANTITITAYATVPGNYTISTDLVNGVMFQASGNFNTTGLISVVLNGTGVPQASGTFTFTPQIIGPAPLGGEACGVQIAFQ